MAKLPLVITPNPILKKISETVSIIDKELQKFLDDMLETMYYEEGVGLAAVQVGVLKRIFVLDMGKKNDHEIKDPEFFINPEIIYLSEEQTVYSEGCLSFPGGRQLISRPQQVKFRYLDYDGNQKEIEAEDYKAHGLLHENDHLNGITLPDYLSPMKRDVFFRQIKKHLRENNK